MHQYRTLVYRSPQGGVFGGSLGQAKYMQISLPLAAHGWYSLYRRAKYFYSLGGSGNGKSMDLFGQGRNCQQSFSRFKVEATLEGENLQVSSRKKREKNHQGLCHLWIVGLYPPNYLGPWGCFTKSHIPSDRAMDHGPMIFVHSRLVKPPLAHSLTQPPGSGLVAYRGMEEGWGLSPPPPQNALALYRKKSTNTDIILRLFWAFKNPAPLWAAPYTVESLGYGPAWKAGDRMLIFLKNRLGMGVDRVFSSALYKGRGRALNTSWTHGVNDRGLDF